jgi:hypothetical protein
MNAKQSPCRYHGYRHEKLWHPQKTHHFAARTESKTRSQLDMKPWPHSSLHVCEAGHYRRRGWVMPGARTRTFRRRGGPYWSPEARDVCEHPKSRTTARPLLPVHGGTRARGSLGSISSVGDSGETSNTTTSLSVVLGDELTQCSVDSPSDGEICSTTGCDKPI